MRTEKSLGYYDVSKSNEQLKLGMLGTLRRKTDGGKDLYANQSTS